MTSILQQESVPSSYATLRLDAQTAEELSLHEISKAQSLGKPANFEKSSC